MVGGPDEAERCLNRADDRTVIATVQHSPALDTSPIT